jgi:hypothetical protein
MDLQLSCTSCHFPSEQKPCASLPSFGRSNNVSGLALRAMPCMCKYMCDDALSAVMIEAWVLQHK